MQYPLLLRAAFTLSALSLFFNLDHFALAQDAGFDVFVTPTNNEVVNAGSNFDIIWSPSAPAGPVTIRLMQGATEFTQEFGPTIASGIDSTLGKYTWSIPSSYGDFASYGFKLQLDADNTIFQYSYPFIIKKASSPSSITVSVSQGPVPTSTAVATITSLLVVTQNTTPNGPASQKPQTSAQSVASSNNSPSAASSVVLSATKADSSSATGAPNSGASSVASATPSGSSSISPSSVSPQTATGASPSTSTAPASTPIGADSGLSMGAKVGIAIGSVAGVCIIALLAYIALLMRRRNRPREPEVEEEEKKMSELGPGLAHEMEGKGKPSELESTGPFQVALKDGRGNTRIEDIAELG